MTDSMPVVEVDVAILSDFRLPGGTTSSIAEEVRAQSAAGISTALIHIAGSVTNYALGFSAHIRKVTGLPHVQVLSPHSHVRAKLIVIRHPTVILSTRHTLEHVHGDHVVVVANHAAIDAGGVQHYDIAAADAKVRSLFGVTPVWAPIGPVVRDTMLQQTNEIPFRDEDWVNIFSVPPGTGHRTGFLGSRPIIGRHSRPQRGKWPSTGDEILAAYPESSDYSVRILGGAEVARHLLGHVPEHWEVIPFGGEDPAVFLKGIDFWVYMHHPDLKEAFGRAAMEALAAGCVAIMPPYMEALFGDAALYAEPAQVRGIIDSYFADEQLFLAQSRRAQEFVQGFSPKVHIDRLAEYGVTSTSSEPVEVGLGVTDEACGSPETVLVILGPDVVDSSAAEGSSGASMAAYARASENHGRTTLVTIGDAPSRQLQHGALHIPDARRFNMDVADWEAYLARRLRMIITDIEAQRICYVGAVPPGALLRALDEHPAEKVWIRKSIADADESGAEASAQIQAESGFHRVQDDALESTLETLWGCSAAIAGGDAT